jgi:hypothetical protein
LPNYLADGRFFAADFFDLGFSLSCLCGFGGILSIRFKTSSRSLGVSRRVKHKTSIF